MIFFLVKNNTKLLKICKTDQLTMEKSLIIKDMDLED